MDRESKETVVQAVNEELTASSLVVRFAFSGLQVEQSNQLRRDMEKIEGTSVRVIKNTLVKIAGNGTHASPLLDELVGPNAFLICRDDVVTPCKTLVKYAKDYEKLEILDGILDGQKIGAEQVKALADMPSREELLARLLYVLNGPKREFVQVLAAVPRSMLNVLNAIKDKQGEQAA
ncbi:MAG: 50S ribosomal protein L10 [Deltaproteobacteria bacterium]|nr:50S ribosomal protein L10 [Deltaproteobacteria bacterium]MCB9487759.1 50S ribosomal protein L10 [Deltaproteobacteria bacterium]